jgi:hypothetical protein
MTKTYIGEQWKTVEFDFEYTNEIRVEISNFGRIRTFHKTSNGNIINGSMTSGYRIVRLKFFTPRDKDLQTQLDYLQQQVFKLTKQVSLMKKAGESETAINETTKLLDNLKLNLKKKFADDTKSRTIHWHSLIHRLVADYFLQKPSDEHTIVAHLDHEKLNNRVGNLKWMTPTENYEHQTNSPYVIKERSQKKEVNRYNSKATKLTVTRVMLLKKMLNQGKPMKQLVKLFKVTETQIIRIRRGENWKDITAAN